MPSDPLVRVDDFAESSEWSRFVTLRKFRLDTAHGISSSLSFELNQPDIRLGWTPVSSSEARGCR